MSPCRRLPISQIGKTMWIYCACGSHAGCRFYHHFICEGCVRNERAFNQAIGEYGEIVQAINNGEARYWPSGYWTIELQEGSGMISFDEAQYRAIKSDPYMLYV